MRVLLLAANDVTEPYPVFPLGMACLAGALERAGHEVRQLDALSGGNAEAAAAIASFDPEVLGISLRNIDNTDSFTSHAHWSLDKLHHLVTFLRARSSAPIVLGGAGFSLAPEAILEYSGADYGIVGEGEELFCRFLHDAAAGRLPEQRVLRAQSAVPEQGSFAPSLPMLRYYAEQSGVLCLQSKRGCPHTCTYCVYPLLEGRKIRARDPETVIEELLFLQRHCHFRELFFTDAVFNDPAGQWLHLAEAMTRRNIHIPWTAFFQPAGLRREHLELCMASGLKAVELGSDAASDATLAGLGKHFGFSEVERISGLCTALRLPAAHYIIFCGPDETQASLDEGLRNLGRLSQSVVFACLGVRLYPGAALHARALREGLLSPQSDCLRPEYYFSPQLEREKAHTAIRRAFGRNRMRVYPPTAGQERMRALRNLGARGILWDMLIRFDSEPLAAGGAA